MVRPKVRSFVAGTGNFLGNILWASGARNAVWIVREQGETSARRPTPRPSPRRRSKRGSALHSETALQAPSVRRRPKGGAAPASRQALGA